MNFAAEGDYILYFLFSGKNTKLDRIGEDEQGFSQDVFVNMHVICATAKDASSIGV